jgi:hypothetical protein
MKTQTSTKWVIALASSLTLVSILSGCGNNKIAPENNTQQKHEGSCIKLVTNRRGQIDLNFDYAAQLDNKNKLMKLIEIQVGKELKKNGIYKSIFGKVNFQHIQSGHTLDFSPICQNSNGIIGYASPEIQKKINSPLGFELRHIPHYIKNYSLKSAVNFIKTDNELVIELDEPILGSTIGIPTSLSQHIQMMKNIFKIQNEKDYFITHWSTNSDGTYSIIIYTRKTYDGIEENQDYIFTYQAEELPESPQPLPSATPYKTLSTNSASKGQ